MGETHFEQVHSSVNAVVDVIFVHGLSGDAKATWDCGGTDGYWPVWLAKDIPNCNIFSLGYGAAVYEKLAKQEMDMFERAENILEYFAGKTIGQRPIVFVAHSLGGILTKMILRASVDSEDEDWVAVSLATQLVIFLSTPHTGASIARVIDAIPGSSRHIKMLANEFGMLQDLNKAYRRFANSRADLVTKVYYEKHATMKSVLVVSRESADPGVAGPEPVAVDRDHFTICKPKDRDDVAYRGIKRYIEKICAKVPPLTGALVVDNLPTKSIQNCRYLPKRAEQNWPNIRPSGIRVNRTVVGRETKARAIHAALSTAGANLNVLGVAVSGSGGMGKSTLARHYAQEYASHYYGIWWLRAHSRDTLIADFVKLAGHLDMDTKTHPTDEALALAVVMALSNEVDPWLLIYDNAEKHGDLREWLPAGASLLVTSRMKLWPGFRVFDVKPLETVDATDLLMSEAGRAVDRNGAESLAVALEGLPLALVLAGAWLRDTPGTGFCEYEARIEALIETHPDEVGLDDYPDSVFGAIQLSLDKLSGNAALLLRVLTYLSPDDLWPDLVTGLVVKLDETSSEWAEILRPIPDALKALAKDRAAVERSFAELVRYSLMERGAEANNPLETGHRVHRLTASVQRSLDGGSSRPAATALLAAGYPEIATLEENWPACARRTPAIPALADAQFGTAALEYLLNQASIWLAMQRRDQVALNYAEQMLCIRETRLGPNHKMTGTACNNLAWRFRRVGRLEDAVSLAQRAFDIGEANSMSGDTRGIRLNTLGLMQTNLANSLTEPARSDMRAGAARHYQEAIALGICLNGRASRQVGVRLKNLATLREAEGRWTLALLLHGRALALKRVVTSPDNLEIAYSLNHLGRVLLKSGRGRQGYRGAGCLDLLVEALMIREAVFSADPGHPERVSTANWLAIAHRALVRPGSPVNGTHHADLTDAEALEKQYSLDATTVRTDADIIAERTQLFEDESLEPPPGSFSISKLTSLRAKC